VEAGTCFLPAYHPYGISDSYVRRLLSEPLISVIDMIGVIGIISVLSASGRHCEERSDEAIQNFLRRSLSEPLIFVIDMINMIGII
jgi:hypothetical protein